MRRMGDLRGQATRGPASVYRRMGPERHPGCPGSTRGRSGNQPPAIERARAADGMQRARSAGERAHDGARTSTLALPAHAGNGGSLETLGTAGHLELDLLALGQALEPIPCQSRRSGQRCLPPIVRVIDPDPCHQPLAYPSPSRLSLTLWQSPAVKEPRTGWLSKQPAAFGRRGEAPEPAPLVNEKRQPGVVVPSRNRRGQPFAGATQAVLGEQSVSAAQLRVHTAAEVRVSSSRRGERVIECLWQRGRWE